MAAKLDLSKTDKDYYKASKTPEIKIFTALPFLSISGKGEPGGAEYTEKISILYPVAYGVKKICKLQDQDFAVPKLEGLWWGEETMILRNLPRDQWCWKLMIRMPDFVTKERIEEAQAEVAAKKNLESELVKFDCLEEGKCAQLLHLGPYSEEGANIDLLHDFIHQQGLTERGLHHEIYLTDPRKSAPEKMKTILRQPVE